MPLLTVADAGISICSLIPVIRAYLFLLGWGGGGGGKIMSKCTRNKLDTDKYYR